MSVHEGKSPHTTKDDGNLRRYQTIETRAKEKEKGGEVPPSQTVSENHRGNVNENADDLLPLMEDESLVES